MNKIGKQSRMGLASCLRFVVCVCILLLRYFFREVSFDLFYCISRAKSQRQYEKLFYGTVANRRHKRISLTRLGFSRSLSLFCSPFLFLQIRRFLGLGINV